MMNLIGQKKLQTFVIVKTKTYFNILAIIRLNGFMTGARSASLTKITQPRLGCHKKITK